MLWKPGSPEERTGGAAETVSPASSGSVRKQLLSVGENKSNGGDGLRDPASE